MRTHARAAAAAVAAAVLPVVLAGCLTGQGPVASERREVQPFTRLEAGSGIRVVLRTGPSGPLTVEAQENLLSVVETSVSGTTLRLGAARDFTSTLPVTVTVATESLEAVTLSGGAEASVEGLHEGRLTLEVKGGARLTVSGSATSVALDAEGGARVDLRGLVTGRVDVSASGAAHVSLQASDAVSGTASGGARVSVGGTAVVDVAASGGAVVARETR